MGDTVITWCGLAERADRLAAGLAERGVGAGDRVDIVTRDPLVLVEMLAACARGGAVAVPRDPADGLGPLSPPATLLDADPGLTSGEPLLGPTRPGPDLESGEAPDMAATLLVLKPSSTRSAQLTHGNVEAVAVAGMAAHGLVPTDRVAVAADAVSPPALATVLAALHAGASVRFPTGHDDDALFDGSASEAPTVLSTTCTELGVRNRAGRPAGGPRSVTVPGPVPDGLREVFGPVLRETYGPAVSGGLALHQRPSGPPSTLVPVLGQRARVVDHSGTPAPAGEAGELELAGSAVAGSGWVRSGDRAVCDEDGAVRVQHRAPADPASAR